MNAKTIEGLKMIRDGINVILNEAVVEDAVQETTVPTVEEPKTVSSSPAPSVGAITADTLSGMTYNALKKFAKENGVSAVGSRSEIEARILGVAPEVADDSAEEEVIETPVKRKAAEKKATVKEVESEPEEEEEDEIVAQVNAAVEDMTTEEIADFLTDSGISAKGKREALIDKLIKAVKNGDIELSDDEDESTEEEVEETSAPEESEDDEETEGDNTNDLDNPEMTKVRKKALKAYYEEVDEAVESGDITRADMIDFICDYTGEDKKTLKGFSDEDITSIYKNCAAYLIDDEGNTVEEEGEPYTVNGENYCCGHALKLVDDTYICEHCGAEYDAE